MHRDERGLVGVIFAILLVPLVGMLALTVDAGYAYGQRRMAQNVADSGAMAGAWVVGDHLMGNTHRDTDVLNAIRDVAKHSTGGFYKTTTSCTWNAAYDLFTAYYVADANGDGVPEDLNIQVGTTCNAANSIPNNAAGVRVIPAKTNPTFFAPVLGVQALGAGARATALARDIIGYGDYAPYGVWGGNDASDPGVPAGNDNRCLGKDPDRSDVLLDHGFVDNYLYGCVPANLVVTYEGNSYERDNVLPSRGNTRWDIGSSSMKGFLHKNVDPLFAGDTVYAAGNAFGDEQPIDMLHQCYLANQPPNPWNSCILVMPVITHAWGEGSNVVLYVSNFAQVVPTNDPDASSNNAWQAQVIRTPIESSSVEVGPCPTNGAPCNKVIRLVQ